MISENSDTRRASGSAPAAASPDALWATILTVGHGGDFFYGRPLWWLRRAADWLIGGPSFRQPRRHPTELEVGDVVDAWRVVAVEPGRRLAMRMEMKAPGVGQLEFGIVDDESGRRVTMDAYWQPSGTAGILYWYALLPAHAFLFRGTTRRIAERAADRAP